MRFLLPLLVCAACKARCEVVRDTPLADEDVTNLGTAEDYLQSVETQALLAGTWWDGRPVELAVEVTRGEGEARYVEYETKGGGWSPFGTEMGLRVCPTVLSVPLHVVVRSDDDAFFVDTEVEAELWDDGPREPWTRLYVEVPYTSALSPDGDVDPVTHHSKTVWANLVYAEGSAELAFVDAGWAGMKNIDGTKHDAHGGAVVLQVGEDPRGQPPVTSEPE